MPLLFLYCFLVIGSERLNLEPFPGMPSTHIFPLCYSSTEVLKKPVKLAEMIVVSKKLSKPFPFVRVDLYAAHGRIYFGELTFTPGNGLENFNPDALDYQLGERINLSLYRLD